MAGALPVIQAISPVIGSLSGGGAPSASPAPAAPSAAPAPEAPKESTASDVTAKEPVVDQEAARVRAAKRRAESEDTLYSLNTDSTATTIAKSLLGE